MPSRTLTSCVALLRGVNVGGHRKLAMDDLREFVAGLGFQNVETLLQSGNVAFRTGARLARGGKGAVTPTALIERQLETEAEQRLGLATDFHVRSADELRTVVATNPFARAAERDPSHLLVLFLKSAPDVRRVRELRNAIPGREQLEVIGRHAYIVYPDGIGTSRLTAALLDAKLGIRGTARNWNTVTKLHEVLSAGT